LENLTVEGLLEEDARALLTAAVPGQLDERVRDRIVVETRGNPLRLLEVLREMGRGELAGGFGTPRAGVSSAPMEEHYARRIRALSEEAQQLLLVAAADPTGDAVLVWRAAQILAVTRAAAAEVKSEQLLEIGARTRFRHPLVRSAAYAAGSPDRRRAAHSALAEAMDPKVDPERRVWHLAAAATAPDEDVASQLEESADAAQARAGLSGAAALLQRSVELTARPERRFDRALAAAEAHLQAGAFDASSALLAEARAAATDDVKRARVERLASEVQYRSNPGPEAPALLVDAAKTLETLDVKLARETYLQAWFASYAAGPYARPGGLLPEVSRAIRSAPPPQAGAPVWDLFLDALAAVVLDGRAASAASYRRAVDAFCGDGVSDGEFIRWAHVASHSSAQLWDWSRWELVSAKHVRLARASGALAPLSIALNGRGINLTWMGDLEAAGAVVQEFDAVNAATGIGGWFSFGGTFLAAYQGRPDALALMSASAARFAEYGVGQGSQFANWTTAILCNGLGRFADAFAAADVAAYEMDIPNGTGWALIELIEAAVRSRELEAAHAAMEQLPMHTLPDSDWAMGVEARCRALVTEGARAEQWYGEAVERLGRTPCRTELARAHLLYGEWLRREGRRADARHQLDPAYEMFSLMGAEAFAERARRELLATGEKVRKRDVSTKSELTPQQEHIARLARDGRSNAEIGAELFLSVRTVEWHLRKVFMKLGIASRRELKQALPARGRYPSVTS
jgi:DNA-binding CsgD family transcriptional regulator